MKVSIIADSRNSKITSGLRSVSGRLFNALKSDMKVLTRDIANNATMHHRFVTSSTNLERSIQNKVEATSNSVTGEIFTNDSIADYGLFVHDGHGSWAPDMFIGNAVLKAKPLIESTLKNTVKKVLGV